VMLPLIRPAATEVVVANELIRRASA
jgi:hypothetical protein